MEFPADKTALIRYGLRHKKSGNILGFSVTSNEGADCCVPERHTLEIGDNMWLVDDAVNAEYVRMFSTDWFNAGYDTPTNPFEPDELEVVEVSIEMRPVNVKIPTFPEYMQQKYNDPESRYYNGLDRYDGEMYSLYDLRELLRDQADRRNIQGRPEKYPRYRYRDWALGHDVEKDLEECQKNTPTTRIDKTWKPCCYDSIRCISGYSITQKREPTHGRCCTCQTCGYDYDNCICKYLEEPCLSCSYKGNKN